ncbi:hypothetical protein BX600DRAFT_504470 [Xylariales sp. PMI_506]|nr:hypothetical protein BX600DRAFT_504470 [Xylariales sp. PMI_506]
MLVYGAVKLTKKYQAERKEKKAAKAAQAQAEAAEVAGFASRSAIAGDEHLQSLAGSPVGTHPLSPASTYSSLSPVGTQTLSPAGVQALSPVGPPTTSPAWSQQYQYPTGGKEEYSGGPGGGGGSGEWGAPLKTYHSSPNDDLIQEIDAEIQGLSLSPPPYKSLRQTGPLPTPVYVPQRRLESQQVGFVRAYAPVLQGCGINEDCWLEFIDGIEGSVRSNTWFHVANMAAVSGAHTRLMSEGIDAATAAAAISIHVGMEAARGMYAHYQENYLDIMNERLFRPHGLCCLIMKHQPFSGAMVEEVNLNGNMVRPVEGRDGLKKWVSAASAASPTASSPQHDGYITNAAPLVFPQLVIDNMSEQQRHQHQREGIAPKVLRGDTLYLVVVNMPTDREVNKVVAQLVAQLYEQAPQEISPLNPQWTPGKVQSPQQQIYELPEQTENRVYELE